VLSWIVRPAGLVSNVVPGAWLCEGIYFMGAASRGSLACTESSLAYEHSNNRYEAFKLSLDFAFAVVILIVSMPVIVAAMVAVKLTSSGPVLYSQRRVGRGGRSFTIYKIRTMIQDSEPDGPKWCVPGDKRVTPVGRLLRWSHLDELPQLINVLRGEMSLIGPRPERPEIIAQLERALPEYRQRLVLRPGLTGLAQVLLPPDTDVGGVGIKLNYDLHYVRHMGPWLDLRIALATFFHLVNAPRSWIARVFRFPFFRVEHTLTDTLVTREQSLEISSPALSVQAG
jgi:lipopolysaccharide/colanic/teichoic acid biosynthesis glycosyltransferase